MLDDGSGTLLNVRSLTNVEIQDKIPLMANIIQTPSSAITNSTIPVKVKVTDLNGNPVSLVDVELETSTGSLGISIGKTDINGFFTTEFNVPYVPSRPEFYGGVMAEISIKSISHEDYIESSGGKYTIVVYPEGVVRLVVAAELTLDIVHEIDTSGNQGFTYLNVVVRDQSNLPVGDAYVSLDIPELEFTIESDASFTDQEGIITFKLTTGPNVSVNDGSINITATKVGYDDGSQELSISVIPYDSIEDDIKTNVDYGQLMPLAMVILVLIGILFYMSRKKR